MPAGGYHGRYLRVDLGSGETRLVPLSDAILRRTLGGVGLGAWLLLKEALPGVDPLAPEAPLIFALSPLVGTPLTTSAKFAVVAKSPLTQRLNDALSSSHFAMAAKRAGFDAMVLVGACAGPSVLVIDGDSIRLEDGHSYWGLPAADTEARLRRHLGEAASVSRENNGKATGERGFHTAAIGVAGENLVRFATISNDGRHAGRGGLGAVMGAKKLKAIAVRGQSYVPLADPPAVHAAARDLSARSFGPATEKYRELGTAANLLVFNRLAVLPTRNFQQSTFEGAEQLSAEELTATRSKARVSCAACTIGCEHVYGVRRDGGGQSGGEGRHAREGRQEDTDRDDKEENVRVEYESLFALGPLCGIADADAVLQATALCDELGLDTISTGGTIAFAMECAERGLITREEFPAPLDAAGPPGGTSAAGKPGPVNAGTTSETPGGQTYKLNQPEQSASLAFGNAPAVLALLRSIAHRDGIGHLLAEGSLRAAAAIGGDAGSFAPHVKGLEIPGYEPRALQAMALGFAVGSRGADHNRSSAYEVDFSEDADRLAGNATSARLAVATEDRAALMDSLILCKFLRGVFDDLFNDAAALLRPVTGWDLTGDELEETARRVVAMRKWFNEREGWTPAEDTLPDRFLTEKLDDGASAGAVLPRARLAAMIEAYNHARGFTPDGRVPETLRRRLEFGEFQ